MKTERDPSSIALNSLIGIIPILSYPINIHIRECNARADEFASMQLGGSMRLGWTCVCNVVKNLPGYMPCGSRCMSTVDVGGGKDFS